MPDRESLLLKRPMPESAEPRSALVLPDVATENAEVWEDFYDTIVSKEREGEPREKLDEVRERFGAKSLG